MIDIHNKPPVLNDGKPEGRASTSVVSMSIAATGVYDYGIYFIGVSRTVHGGSAWYSNEINPIIVNPVAAIDMLTTLVDARPSGLPSFSTGGLL